VEADLARWYHVDYRDRWRFDEQGRRRLTLRRICVLVRHLPAESALAVIARDGQPAWELRDVLLATIWQAAAHSQKPHPLLERAAESRTVSPARARQLDEARRRARSRRRALDTRDAT
jgi:hypothetical protein